MSHAITISGENLVGEMAYEKLGSRSLDYMHCRYSGSKLLFRGPKRQLSETYVAFLGGTETYGKFIEAPFPQLVERRMGVQCINLGWPNAGVDVFLNETSVLEICEKAAAVVIQLPSAQNMNNRFYTVHPRRNDRFVRPSPQMRAVFSEVDFTEFHFTRHMLHHIQSVAADRFDLIRDELQIAWVRRMQKLLEQLGPKTILLWFSARQPGRGNGSPDLALDPAFVTHEMIEAVRDRAGGVIGACASTAAREMGTEGMIFSELEEPAAAELLGPKAHEEAARALAPAVRDLLAT